MTNTTTEMTIAIEEINGCPTMTATKGNVSIIADGMEFILCKAIINHGDRIEEVTDYDKVLKLDRETFTEEEHKEMTRAIEMSEYGFKL